MSEQRYSESGSSSSVSTMQVKIRFCIEEIGSSIISKVDEETVDEGGQVEQGRNLNRSLFCREKKIYADLIKITLKGFLLTSPRHPWTRTWLRWSWKSTRQLSWLTLLP